VFQPVHREYLNAYGLVLEHIVIALMLQLQQASDTRLPRHNLSYTLLWWLAATFLSLRRHGSGKVAVGVRVDRQRQLMQVFRFDTDSCGSNFFSLVKPPSYLLLKTTYPRRHRPIRQSRGRAAMLPECENEEPRCFYRGHFSWALWPRRAPRP
jgi:hypothetical protein